MAENMILATPALSDAGTVTGSATAAGTPVTNLQRMQPTDFTEFSDHSAGIVWVDLGSSKQFNLVALLFTTATSPSALWRVRTASTQANTVTSPSFDSQSRVPGEGISFASWSYVHCLCWIPELGGVSSILARWVRIDIGTPDAVLRAGRLYVANAWQPSRNYQRGDALGFEDGSTRLRAASQETIITRRTLIPAVDFTLSFLEEDEMLATGYEIDRLRGASQDVLVMLNPRSDDVNRQKKLCYGLIEPGGRIVDRAFRVFERSYQVRGLV